MKRLIIGILIGLAIGTAVAGTLIVKPLEGEKKESVYEPLYNQCMAEKTAIVNTYGECILKCQDPGIPVS